VFALGIPQLAEPLRLRGKVVWITSGSESSQDNPAGMGIEFQFAHEEERRDKVRVVEALLVAELGEHIAERLLGRKPEP
jgi:type IV pilus assembly protein PilZ